MSRALHYDVPGPDWRVALPAAGELSWQRVFAPALAPPLRLAVEIGFGRGEFLMRLAADQPDVAFVGIEYSFKRVLKVARRLARTQLTNVRLVQAEGRQAVRELLEPASVEAFWINFPDPWPKKRHHKRRLIQPGFVREAAGRLVPGGHLHVATDHVAYAEQIHEVLCKEPRLENAYAPRPFLREVPGRKPTAYELEWRAEGRALHFFGYRRGAGRPSFDTSSVQT